MDGVIILNKSSGFTSNDALYKVKKKLNPGKIGHAGTLDPLASGVLVVMINGATKLSDYLTNNIKKYRTEITIGIATTTGDADGEIIEQVIVNPISSEQIDAILSTFLGKSEQIPPMYSAIKVKGEKLYNLARKGIEIKREPRKIEIYDIRRTTDIIYHDNTLKFCFETTVSKGTYIRTLCIEIGERLHYPAHMSGLVRTASGKFTIENSYTVDDIANGNFHIIPLIELLKEYPIFDINNAAILKSVKNGMPIGKMVLGIDYDVVIMRHQNDILAMYKCVDNIYKVEIVWN